MPLHLLRRFRDNLPISVIRHLINWWPPLLGAGIVIKDMSPDYRSVDVVMKQHWFNKNYVGTHFGGSIFAMTDPFYMLMLFKNLGDDYIVWDKAAKIDFLKPGRGTLHASFRLTDDILKQVHDNTSQNQKYIFDIPVEVKDDQGVVIASVIRTLYTRRKEAFKDLPPIASNKM
jgi:acyl-coenzyme A thioesterase PaaI-like protein